MQIVFEAFTVVQLEAGGDIFEQPGKIIDKSIDDGESHFLIMAHLREQMVGQKGSFRVRSRIHFSV